MKLRLQFSQKMELASFLAKSIAIDQGSPTPIAEVMKIMKNNFVELTICFHFVNILI
jgi:hypothetical protein